MHQTRQIQLERRDGDSTISTTCWVPYDNKGKRVKLGMQITLGDDEENYLWTVIGMSEVQDKQPNRGWNNNI